MLIFGTPFLYVTKVQFKFRSNFLHKAAKKFPTLQLEIFSRALLVPPG